MLPSSLQEKLDIRKQQGALRELRLNLLPIDFCSNDYLGLAREKRVTHDPSLSSGSTGSRLLAGNYPLLGILEGELAEFHRAEAGLLYNSGYDANVGLLSSVPQKGDVVLYDALAHASIRDGIRLSFAQAFSFRHNDMEDLEKKLRAAAHETAPPADTGKPVPIAAAGPGPAAPETTPPAQRSNIFVVTETLFSMDGDFCPLENVIRLCRQYGAWLIVDEAHATGVVGERGEGLVQQEGAEADCFARVHTFGKAVGCHGAVVLGSALLRQYLINFSRALIYTTALPPASAGLIRRAYGIFPGMNAERKHLETLISQFQSSDIPFAKLPGTSPIQAVLIPGNERVRKVAAFLQEAGLDVRPILYPTVPRDTERLRVVLHSFNTTGEVKQLVHLLNKAESL